VGGSPAPDLTVSGVTLGSTSGEVGDTFSVTYTRANTGTADAGSFRLSVRFSLDTTIDTSDAEACDAWFSSGMTAGTSATKTISGCTVPTVGARSYYVGVIMDVDGDVTEAI